MQRLLDVLVSGVHDTKNQLFIAESLLLDCAAEDQSNVSEARYAIEAAANRLSRVLNSYRLLRHGAKLAIVPVIVADLCAEVALAQGKHLAKAGIALDIDCPVVDECLLDRDLVSDMLNNAVQNAGRFARQQVRLSARHDARGLILSVEDDGPGFASLPPPASAGLLLAERLAELHVRQGRCGSLQLDNGSVLGGARFELRLP